MVKGGSSVVVSSGDNIYKSLSNNCHPQWWRDPGLRVLIFAILSVFGSATANGYDGSLMNGLLAIPAFKTTVVEKVNTNVLGLVIAGISLGGVPMLVPAGYVSDYFGRKVAVGIGSLIMLIFAIVQTFTPGPYAFLGTRICLGAGIAFILVGAPPLAAEIAHPRFRGNVSNSFQTAFYWGSILSAIATLGGLYVDGSWSWRMPVFLQLFFPFIQMAGLLTITPESPRYLVSKGREKDAFRILVRFHANGHEDDELVQYEFSEICEAIGREKDASGSSSWADFVATKGNRHRLAICLLVGIFIQWAGNGVVSYYLAPILESVGVNDPVQQASINLGLQIWNAIIALAGAFAAEKYGRRPLWLTSATGMLFSFIIVTALSGVYAEQGNKAAGRAVIFMLFIFFGFYDIAFTPLSFAYPTEILPFKLRSRGLSLTLVTIFASGFFNQYVNPIGLERAHWRFYFVYVACLAAMIVIIYFVFPETKGRSLEEIAVIFDGERAESQAHRRASSVAMGMDGVEPMKRYSLSTEKKVVESPERVV